MFKAMTYIGERGSAPLARDDELTIEELGDELLVYDLKTDRAHSLSAVAARVWRACDGSTEVPALAGQLGLDADEATRALDELDGCELLAPRAGTGLSRRDLTVRVMKGAAAAASAPLIVSIAAPTPAAALTPGCEAVGGCLDDCGNTTHGCQGTACACCNLTQIKCPRGGGGVQRTSFVKFCNPGGNKANCPSMNDPTLCTTPCPPPTARSNAESTAEQPSSLSEPSAPGSDPATAPESTAPTAPAPEPPPASVPEPAPAPTTPAPETPTTPAPAPLETP